MERTEFSTHEFAGVSVYFENKPTNRVGKVRSFVFHPKKRTVIGFTVKRPDVALMFHRQDLFVALDSFWLSDGKVMVSTRSDAVDKAALKRLGLSWDECLMWQGMSVLSQSGKSLGYVGSVSFSVEDGRVLSLHLDKGATSELLLGAIDVPGECISGFQFGVGESLNAVDEDDFQKGAIIVSDSVLDLEAEGGLAEKAGKATAKANQVLDQKVRTHTNAAIDKAGDALESGAYKAGEFIGAGASKVTQQLGKTKGMFASFKEEYKKALQDDASPSSDNDQAEK